MVTFWLHKHSSLDINMVKPALSVRLSLGIPSTPLPKEITSALEMKSKQYTGPVSASLVRTGRNRYAPLIKLPILASPLNWM